MGSVDRNWLACGVLDGETETGEDGEGVKGYEVFAKETIGGVRDADVPGGKVGACIAFDAVVGGV